MARSLILVLLRLLRFSNNCSVNHLTVRGCGKRLLSFHVRYESRDKQQRRNFLIYPVVSSKTSVKMNFICQEKCHIHDHKHTVFSPGAFLIFVSPVPRLFEGGAYLKSSFHKDKTTS